MSIYGLLFDQTMCIGCGACEQACQAEHDQEPHEVTRLDDNSYNWVEDLGDDVFSRHFCMSCEDPTCVSVCPVAAFTKTELGPVIWDASKCMGCRYCMLGCPFEIPKFEWYSRNPRIAKCDMCIHRVSERLPTACASICPTGATTFGLREDLLREAHRRLDEDPERYTGRIYGEYEAGGTAVLMLLSRDPAASGLPANVPQESLPHLTWNILEKLPQVIPVWGVFLGGMYWLTSRKNDVAEIEGYRREHDDD